MPETLQVVRALHPELLPIVERGEGCCCHDRPALQGCPTCWGGLRSRDQQQGSTPACMSVKQHATCCTPRAALAQPLVGHWSVCQPTPSPHHPHTLPVPPPPSGSLVVYRRPPDYVERRTDGYREPELIWLLGTAHVSATSAAEVAAVVQVMMG